MNPTWLEDFLALAESGNFSRAAARRHSSQPAFSRRIRALEDWIGQPLVDRSAQPARLTEVGTWFRDVAAELLARTQRLPAEAAAVAQAQAGPLRIAATHALSFTFVPGWLRGIEERIALGPLQLVSDVLERCEALVAQGQVHFVVAHAHPAVQGPLEAAGCPWVRIGADRLLPVAAPDAQGRPRHALGAGRAVPLLRYSDESGLGRLWRATLAPRLDAAAQPLVTAHLASVLRPLALEGRGVAWLPASLVEPDLAAGRLVAAGGADWEVPLEIRLWRGLPGGGPAAEALWRAAQTAAGTTG